ncbi:OmpA family protein [Nitrosomonas aestuarii]|uniref:OmpA family protein n=1 Tax=Nitrosomonas aestuarii TaxID=52441 RepID=UPI000D313B68|nr:OmpA family protein [Nitrosomonas aestuarii]
MFLKKFIPVLLMVIMVAGCANMTQSQRSTAQGTAAGTGIGAAAGAVIGAIAGDPALGAGIGAGVGAIGGYIWSSRMEKQKQQMEQVTTGTGSEVTQTQNNQLKMDVPGDFSFDTGRADIKPEMRPVLNSLVAGLMSNPNAQVNIVGHTDSTGTDTINNPLSVNRAASTRNYIASQGIAMNRIHIDGRGSYEPVASNNNATGRAKNRRVEIYMFEPQYTQQQQLPQHQMPQTSPQYPPQQPVNYPSQPGYY